MPAPPLGPDPPRRRRAHRAPRPSPPTSTTCCSCTGSTARVNRRRLERELVLAWDSGAVPVVVLTKADLVADVDAAVAEAEAVALGVDVLAVSATDGRGLDRLARLRRAGTHVRAHRRVGHRQVHAGQRPRRRRASGHRRRSAPATSRGRHTTTAGELVVLTGGAILIDTPGHPLGRPLVRRRRATAWPAPSPTSRSWPRRAGSPTAPTTASPGCAVRDGVDDGAAGQLAAAAPRAGAHAGRSRRLGAGRGQQAACAARMRSYKRIKPRPVSCAAGAVRVALVHGRVETSSQRDRTNRSSSASEDGAEDAAA